MKIILASASPRRKQLLAKIIPNYEIIPAASPEVCAETEPKAMVMQLAYHKAFEVWQSNRDALVLGCDTMVDFDGEILGKPHDAADARRMLAELSGNTHLVHTGACLLCDEKYLNIDSISDVSGFDLLQSSSDTGIFGFEILRKFDGGNFVAILFCETSSVTFRKLSSAEISAYITSGAPMDKAGAYGIQECDFVASYAGSRDNIAGLPTERLATVLKIIGLSQVMRG